MNNPLNTKLILEKLFSETHPITLGLFRIAVGIIMLIQFINIEEYITVILPQSEYFITYDYFGWVKLMSPENVASLFLALKLAALFFILGVFYRIASIVMFLGWTYIFLLDAGHYNNHYYLYALVLFIMIFLQANKWGTITQLFTKKAIVSIPLWNIWMLRFQMVVVYFYGGIAKINSDWLNGYPMRYWLGDKTTSPFWNELLTSEVSVYLFSYFGLFFDLSIGFLLLYKKTRKWALIPLVLFHISNHFLWNIGTFPYFSLAATIVFFPANDVAKWFKLKAVPAISEVTRKKSKLVVSFLVVFVLFQTLFPLRHFFYKGPASWNGYGDAFSWRMMLTTKVSASKFKIKIPSQNIEGYVDLNKYVNQSQIKRFLAKPEHVWKFALHLGQTMKDNGAKDVEIYSFLWKSVNGREYQLLIDTNVNLMDYPYDSFRVPEFILPMKDTPHKDVEYILSEEEYSTKFKN